MFSAPGPEGGEKQGDIPAVGTIAGCPPLKRLMALLAQYSYMGLKGTQAGLTEDLPCSLSAMELMLNVKYCIKPQYTKELLVKQP